MNPKTYLLQIQKLEIKIRQLKRERDEIASVIGLSGSSLDGERVSRSAKNEAPFVRLVEKINEIENKLSTLLNNYVDKKNEIISQIHAMENENYMNLLYKKYVEGKRLNVIADEMGYSYRQVNRIHGYALLKFGNAFLKDVL